MGTLWETTGWAVLIAVGLSLVTADAFADLCGGNARAHPGSYVGLVRPDPNDPDRGDEEWLGRIADGQQRIVDFPDGPIWDGDSTANDDADYLTENLPDSRQTEYESLGWKHPVNLAVGGDYVPYVLYRLYALEQKSTFNVRAAPAMLRRDAENALFHVQAPFMVIHVGTNAIYKSESAPDIVADIAALTCEFRRDLPALGTIVVVSIYPRGPFFNVDVAKRNQINRSLGMAAAAKQFPFIFVDATHYLENLCAGHFDSKGQCIYFKDFTHPLAPASYGVDKLIAKALKAAAAGPALTPR